MLLNASNETDYNILTALRGPDNIHAPGAMHTKELTTAVLRHFAKVSGDCALVASPADAVIHWNSLNKHDRQNVHEFIQDDSHFRFHIRKGFESMLLRLGMDSPPKQRYLKAYWDELCLVLPNLTNIDFDLF